MFALLAYLLTEVLSMSFLCQPPFQRMYRLVISELQEVQRQITELLSKQLIEPSTSPYGAPVLFVEKKKGELRMVVDCCVLNKLTVKIRYPLPRIDDLFDKSFGAKCFSCLNAASLFHQILLKEAEKPKTAFQDSFWSLSVQSIALWID